LAFAVIWALLRQLASAHHYAQLSEFFAGWHPQQFAHHYAQLYELPAGWHLPHVTSQIEQRASLEQDDFDRGAGPPKGPPLPLCSLV